MAPLPPPPPPPPEPLNSSSNESVIVVVEDETICCEVNSVDWWRLPPTLLVLVGVGVGVGGVATTCEIVLLSPCWKSPLPLKWAMIECVPSARPDVEKEAVAVSVSTAVNETVCKLVPPSLNVTLRAPPS